MDDAPLLPLRTARLLLREASPDDVEDMLVFYREPEVTRFVPFGPQDAAQVRDRVERWRADGTRPRAVGEALHAVVVPDDGDHAGRVVGDVMVRLSDGDPPSVVEVGWIFSPAVAGRGYATEAAAGAVGLAFDRLGAHRVVAQLDPRNRASSRLCARLGMTEEAHLRRSFQEPDGSWTDTGIWGLLREEWPPTAPSDPPPPAG